MQAAKHNPTQLQQFAGGCRSTGTAPWHHCRLLLYSHLGKPENFSKFWKTKANQNLSDFVIFKTQKLVIFLRKAFEVQMEENPG